MTTPYPYEMFVVQHWRRVHGRWSYKATQYMANRDGSITTIR